MRDPAIACTVLYILLVKKADGAIIRNRKSKGRGIAIDPEVFRPSDPTGRRATHVDRVDVAVANAIRPSKINNVRIRRINGYRQARSDTFKSQCVLSPGNQHVS